MSVSSTTSRVSYAGNGSTTAFPFAYYFQSTTDLVVILRVDATGVETVKSSPTHYSVSGTTTNGVYDNGGTVTMVTAPASGETLIIYRDPALTQGLDLGENDSLPAESVEQALDKAIMIAQRLDNRIDRSIRLSEGFSPAFDLELPSDLDQAADTVPLINSTGDGFADVADWPTATAINDAATEAAAAAASAAAASASATAADGSATLASQWATKTTGQVAATDYSAKAYAIGGTGVTDTLGAGAAKEWATKMSGTVDTSEYSAKYYANQAATAVASAFFRDVIFLTSADSPYTILSSHNGKAFSVDTSGGAVSITLPEISTLTLPFNVAIKLETAGNNLTINRSGTDTIGTAATSKTLSAAGTGTQLTADTDPAPDRWTEFDFATVADGAISAAKLASNAVTPVKLDEDAVLYGIPMNFAIVASVAANALTLAVKDKDGSDASATSPVRIPFRHATATTGQYTLVNVTSSLSMTVSSGSTLGHFSALTHPIYLYAINNSGTAELAVSTTWYPLGSIISTTAEGGAGGADSNSTIYSTTSRSNVPITPLAKLTISEATAGTWASAPTAIALWPFEVEEIFADYETNAGQTLSASATDIIDFEDRNYDSHGCVTTGASWKFTAPKTTYYLIDARVLIGNNPIAVDTALTMTLYKNGSSAKVLDQHRYFAGTSVTHHIIGSAKIRLTAGEYIDIRVINGDDSSQSLTSSALLSSIQVWAKG